MKLPVLNFSPTEQHVLYELSARPQAATQLVDNYKGPKQSIYKALRSLSEKGVVSGDKTLSLSKLWIHNITTLLSGPMYSTEPMWHLHEGEKLMYYFDDFFTCDQYFFQLYLTLPDFIPISEPFVFHNPHQWFFLTKYESESLFWNQQFEQGRQCYVSISGRTDIDKHIGYTMLQHLPTIRFSLSNTKLRDDTYYTIIDDWIVEAKPEQSLNLAIDTWFDSHKTATPENIELLMAVTTSPSRIKMTITRNHVKAETLRTKILRDFV
jgi:hypothetical protein